MKYIRYYNRYSGVAKHQKGGNPINNILLKTLRALEGLIDRVLAAAGALVMVQFPMFYAQYLQRLGGHLNEAGRIVSGYRKAAAANHLSLEEYIDVHLTSHDNVFVSTGKVIRSAVERFQHLESAFRALKGASPFTRLWAFIQKADPKIVGQTWRSFTPGVPTTLESFIYALFGILIAWGIYRGIKGLVVLCYREIAVPERVLPRKPGIPA
ncbi:MAG: DUF2937 family protein [Bacillota bacterium]